MSNENKLQCPVCQEYFSRIDTIHLRSHNLTKAQYLEQYPNAPFGHYRIVKNGYKKNVREKKFDTESFNSGYEAVGHAKKLKNIETEISKLLERGLTVIGEPEYNKFNVRLYTVIRKECGHQFITRAKGGHTCAECANERAAENAKALQLQKEQKAQSKQFKLERKVQPNCLRCNVERHPASKPGFCISCASLNAKEASNIRYYDKLIDLGYIVHTNKEDLHDKMSRYDVTNTKCGHRFTAQGGNILSELTKCAICGPTNRMKNALAAYVLKYGKTDSDMTNEDNYYYEVWRITNSNWDDNAGRSHNGDHLDHIIPISWGFRNAMPPEMIGDIDNLQLLPYKQNLAKGAKVQNFDVLSKLLKKFGLGACIEIIDGPSVRLKTCIEMLFNRITTIPSYINIKTGEMHFGKLVIKIIDVDMPTQLEKTENTIILFSDEIEYSSNNNRKLRIAVSRINNAIGNVKKLRASKMTVKEIKPLASCRFLDTCHMQGRKGAKIHLGLFLEDELMSVMTFGTPYLSHNYEWELIRFASKIDHRIHGAASKLFNYFVKHHNPISIVSYSDNRWGNGNVYRALNFKSVSAKVKQNYFWSKDGLRRSRYNTRRDDLPLLLGPAFDANKTEKANMVDCGWTCVQDLGSEVFSWSA